MPSGLSYEAIHNIQNSYISYVESNLPKIIQYIFNRKKWRMPSILPISYFITNVTFKFILSIELILS